MAHQQLPLISASLAFILLAVGAVGYISAGLWGLIPLLVVLLTAYAISTHLSSDHTKGTFLTRLVFVVCVGQLLGSVLPFMFDAPHDSPSPFGDMLTLWPVTAPPSLLFGILVGWAFHMRQGQPTASSLVIAQFTAMTISAVVVLCLIEMMANV